jgi:hypothetical protein
MPDWISHILIALIIVELFNIKPRSLVVLGSILPDFFFKSSILGAFFTIPISEIYWGLLPLHLPIGTFLFTLVIASLFRFNYPLTILLITIGWTTHYASDALFKNFIINPQAMLLFPFSWRPFGFNILWSNEYYIILIITILVYTTIKLFKVRLTKAI